jgi:hypothetical protein
MEESTGTKDYLQEEISALKRQLQDMEKWESPYTPTDMELHVTEDRATT